jgi:HSP20 family protein
MAIERWQPMRDLGRGRSRGASGTRNIGSVFDRFFSEWPEGWGLESAGWTPSVDMVERNDEVILRADMPGMSEKDLDVSFRDGVVTIRGERKEEREEKKDENYYCCERWSGEFTRSLMLPPGVDAEKSSASFRNGVLEIRFPKNKAASGRRIEIKAA